MEREGKKVPAFVRSLLDSGEESFYRRSSEGVRCYFDLPSAEMKHIEVEPGVVVLADRKAEGGEVLRNWSASLVDLGDGVGCLEFHSALQPAMNPIDGAILDMLAESLARVGQEGMTGLVISHQSTHFSVGANLALILELARSKKFDVIGQISKIFQDLTQMIHYAPFPVVAAPFSLCLGGGFEMVAPCHQIVALAELYCGAVEVGVGLIPGAGGNLRVLTHFTERLPAKQHGPMAAVQKAFETIAFAKISASAYEAVELGYLREDNLIVLSRDHQISMAKEIVLTLAKDYQVPKPAGLVLPGLGGKLAIQSVVQGYRMTGKISKHDALIAKGLAHLLTGGSRANGIDPVEESYLLELEREVFVSLAGEEKSQDRMAHMLKTGKPLRN
jgi:3-hydroxyacyl-CoA dehydrogenase